MEEMLRKGYPALWEEYQKVVKKYQDENWGIYETEYDKSEIIHFCDAYYGDGNTISQAMVMAGKPVMLQNFDC